MNNLIRRCIIRCNNVHSENFNEHTHLVIYTVNFGCLLRTSNVGGSNEVGIGEFRLQPNVTSTSIGESNIIRIVLVFIFVRFSDWLVYDKAIYNINLFVVQECGDITWRVSDSVKN